MQSTRPSTDRKPLTTLPLELFLRAACTSNSTSSSSCSSPSPKKRSRLLGDMSLLPSPFLSSSTTPRHASGPLLTLYEAPKGSPRRDGINASPQRRMLARDEEERLGDDEMPLSSPRRLLDLFQASEKKSGGGRALSGSGSGSGGSPVRGMRGSMPPPSPRRTLSPFMGRKEEKEKEEEPPAPTWTFYQDDDDEVRTNDDKTETAEDATMSSPAVSEEGETDLTPLDKENTRPPPRRRRSASLLSQSSTPILTTASNPFPSATAIGATSSNLSPVRPPPLPLPVPSLSAPSTLEHDPAPRTPPAIGSSSPGFPSYPDLSASTNNPLSAFGEGAASSFSPVLRGDEAEGVLLGGGVGRKRHSLEQAGGVEKRFKEDEEE